jgi:hypothetical protein
MSIVEDGPSGLSPAAQEMLDKHRAARQVLVEKENKLHFSYELEASLTDAERAANTKICEAREEIANNEFLNRTIHNYFTNKAVMETSKLFKMLNQMPKGAIHHIHTTAANPIDAYLKLTYDDRTYYNQREDLFKVYPKHKDVKEGYIQTTVLRSFAASDKEFDE